MTPFYDRIREMAVLDTVWQAPEAQLVTLWGRRRVGKSTLLARFAAGKHGVYLYGTRLAEREVLTDLARQTAAAFTDPYLRAAPFPAWGARSTI